MHVRRAPEVPVPVVIDRAIDAALVVTVFPNASRTLTFGWIVHTAFAAPPPGWVVNVSCAAGPAVTLNALLMTESDDDVAVSL